jgi:hypothetical protein
LMSLSLRCSAEVGVRKSRINGMVFEIFISENCRRSRSLEREET